MSPPTAKPYFTEKSTCRSKCSDCQKTIVLSLRDPAGVVAISQNNFASCMFSGEYGTFLIRLPRRCAPRNDTSGTFSTRWARAQKRPRSFVLVRCTKKRREGALPLCVPAFFGYYKRIRPPISLPVAARRSASLPLGSRTPCAPSTRRMAR